jgi:hypothetical protein
MSAAGAPLFATVVVGLFALAACTTMEQKAARYSSPTLCYMNYAGGMDEIRVTSQELARRRFTCTQADIQMGAMEWQQIQNRKAAAFESGLRLMTPPAPPPRQQQCQWQTNANGTGSMVCF